jgi:hypothetical protein
MPADLAGAASASRLPAMTAFESPPAPPSAPCSVPGTDTSPDRLSPEAAADLPLSASVTDEQAGQATPNAIYLGQRMLYGKGTGTVENLNPLENTGFLRRILLHAVSVTLVWALGSILVIAAAAILRSLAAGILLSVAWFIVTACVFWLSRLSSQLAEWNFLVDGKAGLAPQTFEYVAWAFGRRGTPMDFYRVRRLPLRGRGSRDVLEVQHGIFHGLVSCFASGNDLYIGWTFWLSLSPAHWLLLWLWHFLWWHHRHDHAVYMSLQSDEVKALREALHGAVREGVEAAAGQRAAPGGETASALVPVASQQRK